MEKRKKRERERERSCTVFYCGLLLHRLLLLLYLVILDMFKRKYLKYDLKKKKGIMDRDMSGISLYIRDCIIVSILKNNVYYC